MHNTTVNLRESDVPDPANHAGEMFSGQPKRRHSRKVLKIVIAAVIAVFIVWYVWSFIESGTTWKAVFLSNNQVYFGHFWDVPFSSVIDLRDVYYLQVSGSDTQLSDASQSQFKLVKLGNEIHGPTDEMMIPMSQVLFWETLRPDSAIVTTIENGQFTTSTSTQ